MSDQPVSPYPVPHSPQQPVAPQTFGDVLSPEQAERHARATGYGEPVPADAEGDREIVDGTPEPDYVDGNGQPVQSVAAPTPAPEPSIVQRAVADLATDTTAERAD